MKISKIRSIQSVSKFVAKDTLTIAQMQSTKGGYIILSDTDIM